MKPILAILCLALAACASKAPTPILPPPKGKPVTGEVRAAADTANKSAEIQTRASERIARIESEVAEAQQVVGAAASEARRLAHQKTATPAELLQAAELASQVEPRVAKLKQEVARLSAIHKEQFVNLVTLQKQLADATITAAQADQVAEQTAAQLESVTTQYKAAESGRQKATAKLEAVDARKSLYRNWLIGIGAAVALWIAVKLYLKLP
ncbi:MAG: hypothetical protein QM627_00050 [Luteolibacter sp.]